MICPDEVKLKSCERNLATCSGCCTRSLNLKVLQSHNLAFYFLHKIYLGLSDLIPFIHLKVEFFPLQRFKMIHWLQCAIVCWIGVSFVLSFPSLSCPESSSSRWCEMHSNQQTWPPMVPSSPAADAWTIGKFATPTKQGLQGSDAICGQDVGGTQW
jgi:hypothetical protein